MPDVESLSTAELPALGRLLVDAGLPDDDIDHSSNRFFGIHDSQQLIACGGLQSAGTVALLRSVAVLPAHQGKGLGRQMVEALLQEARVSGITELYLLTETGSGYFESFGFQRIERAKVPDAITRTAQFSSLCPDTASCLMKTLARESPGPN